MFVCILMHSYSSIGIPRQKFLMSKKQNLALGVEMVLLSRILMVGMSAVSVVVTTNQKMTGSIDITHANDTTIALNL